MSETPSGPVSQEMIHPTALEPIKDKEENAPKVGVGVSPPPTPPSKDDEDIIKGAQPSSQDFNPLTADTDSVHNDSHAKSVESVEPGASTHEPKPTILKHDKVESARETTHTQQQRPIQQEEPMPSFVTAASTPPQTTTLDEKAITAGEFESSAEKNQQDDTIEQAAASIPTAPAAETTRSDHDEITTTNDDKKINGSKANSKENGHGATKKLKREASKKKPLFGFLKKTSTDKDGKRKAWQFWK
ncbi:hypothetical protein K492DRAFT_209114 [Lichtheimia hyalospora FSU 10163]|nr:hypothetical protein K492DRAFT_209114 [Lichtheimia hyalospora FSU 10163]